MAASDNCCNLAQLSIIGRGLTVRSTRTRFVVSFKCVATCYIAGSQLSWQRVGLTQALGRRSILESPCFSHLKQSCRSEEHTSELLSLIRISYAFFCLTTETKNTQ